ncbi:MAG: IS91 family transposase [Gammaproteobacteria bacterium]|nr:IS91 family transposase [Gammaproteobacteria bacterium]
MSSAAACARPAATTARTAVYQSRRPERTVVYQVVQRHLETWLEESRGHDPEGEPVPAYIERDFRHYLTCGILAHGFARARCAGCGHDFLVAFACKGRGVCPSCTTRRMAETAAHLVDHVLPQVQVRQWVLSLPKRLRYFLHHDPRLVNPVLRIFLAEVEAALRAGSLDAPSGARFGAVTFVHRFGSALNAHLHFHCCVIDGLFSAAAEGLRFHPACLTDQALAQVQRQTRRRVLQLFQRRALLPEEATALMLGWDHGGGFSVDAAVRVPAWDRAGLERLLRYCARPIFASERLAWAEFDERLIYQLPKPRPDGRTMLSLTPLEFLDHLAALIPPPRKHRHRYHGVLAPHAPLRAAVTAYAGLPLDGSADPLVPPAPAVSSGTADTPPAAHARYLWVVLIARIYEILPLICPVCGSEMRLIAAVTEPEPVRRILRHVGEPTLPPPVSPARSPPLWDSVDWDQTPVTAPEHGEPAPEFQFDQTVSW